MKLMFDNVSANVCKLTTQTYSTSFSWGIYFLDNRLRNSIYAIYGFVRLADEIVDSFHDYNKKRLLQKLKEDTWEAIEDKISCNPILNAFQQAIHRYDIDMGLVARFLRSMEMDLEQISYDRENYDEYILGSAEVVGLMCLYVFTEGNKNLYEELKPYAMKLGAAFQKVNFLRDIRHDQLTLGRTYFPQLNHGKFDSITKKQVEDEIEQDFNSGLEGIRKLPVSSKGGVYLAYVYYRTLFRKIKALESEDVMGKRIRISNGKKLGLMFNSLVECKMRLI